MTREMQYRIDREREIRDLSRVAQNLTTAESLALWTVRREMDSEAPDWPFDWDNKLGTIIYVLGCQFANRASAPTRWAIGEAIYALAFRGELDESTDWNAEAYNTLTKSCRDVFGFPYEIAKDKG